jgi:hypothetical protein
VLEDVKPFIGSGKRCEWIKNPGAPPGDAASKSLFSNIDRKRAKQLIVSRGALEHLPPVTYTYLKQNNFFSQIMITKFVLRQKICL